MPTLTRKPRRDKLAWSDVEMIGTGRGGWKFCRWDDAIFALESQPMASPDIVRPLGPDEIRITERRFDMIDGDRFESDVVHRGLRVSPEVFERWTKGTDRPTRTPRATPVVHWRSSLFASRPGRAVAGPMVGADGIFLRPGDGSLGLADKVAVSIETGVRPGNHPYVPGRPAASSATEMLRRTAARGIELSIVASDRLLVQGRTTMDDMADIVSQQRLLIAHLSGQPLTCEVDDCGDVADVIAAIDVACAASHLARGAMAA